MNNGNSNVIQMSKRDYFALPDHYRMQANGPMVLTVRNGRETFVRVDMLE